ncbi:MAG: molybdopterin-guanine dinucleotide biosynthesis protein B [Campylobacteraceae bacterium]|jgi:molybdopterin-guanine dinucleotide biosynthesis protein B|nr:molybdopterin-guanine dinucleotide biosynthesis protein B [Campylobacteraceae bacterium]
MSPLAIAFTGPSESGKTTLILKLASLLSKQYKIAIIKHDPHDKAVFDTEGKDSFKFFQTGAEVVVTSPARTTLFSNRAKSIDEIIPLFSDFDILLVEGLKTLPLPRIGVFRDKLDESYFECCKALAVDESVEQKEYNIPKELDILDLNDAKMIASWIFKNAKILERHI